jgi:gluconokinase
MQSVDGDRLHSAHNKEWTASSRALSDEQRLPWLPQVGECLALGAGSSVVVACSAVRRSYRDLLREHAPTMLMVFAKGDVAPIHDRITSIHHEYIPPSLLRSQLNDLEERQDDELDVTVDIAKTPEQIVERIMTIIPEGSIVYENQQTRDLSRAAALVVRPDRD